MAFLASDARNPEFVGAHNPDDRLAVIFYSKPVKQEFDSQAQGRPIFKDVDFVKIHVPGDNTTVIDVPVREDHRERFPRQWAHYQNKHGGDAREVGTPLSEWSRLTGAQVEELRALKFFTVENVAGASDAHIQNIAMIAGMNPYKFREHAQRFLELAQRDSLAQAAEDRVKALEQENAKLKEDSAKQAAETAEKFAALQEQIAQLGAKKKPGRPRQVAEAA